MAVLIGVEQIRLRLEFHHGGFGLGLDHRSFSGNASGTFLIYKHTTSGCALAKPGLCSRCSASWACVVGSAGAERIEALDIRVDVLVAE